MPTFEPAWAQHITQGRWVGDPLTQPATGFSIDTRTLKPGEAFVAIKGPNHDGHDHVAAALAAGAPFAIVAEDSSLATRHSTLAVPDPLKAMQALAVAHRDRLAEGICIVISVSGSNGKTTTRHLIHHVLTHAGKRGTQSPKSFNNHLGVPLTLLAADPSDDFVACEVGTNHPGEIDTLGAIVRPDVAVITSIGEEHLEFFGDLEGVAKEEYAILRHLARDGLLMLGESPDDVPQEFWKPLAEYMPREYWDRFHQTMDKLNDLTFGQAAQIAVSLSFEMFPGFAPLRCAAQLAASVGLGFGVTEARLKKAMSVAPTFSGRWEVNRLPRGVTLIHDAYNANPTSMFAALEGLRDHAADRRVAVLGQMNELGMQSPYHHWRVGQKAKDSADLVVAIGPDSPSIEKGIEGEAPAICYADWSDDLPDKIVALLEPGDVVLLKASRGIRLERLIPAIEARFGPRVHDESTPRST